jgi:hypothetical protein
MRFLRKLTAFVTIAFLVPAVATLAWWALKDRPPAR